MIERMKQICVVSSESKKDEMLGKLNELGILHIFNRSGAASDLTDRFIRLSRNASNLKDYSQKKQALKPLLSDDEFNALDEKVAAAVQAKTEAVTARTLALVEIDKISKWGDFDIDKINELKELGYSFKYYQLGKKDYAELCKDPECSFIKLSSVDKLDTIAVLGECSVPAGIEFMLPDRGITKLNEDIKEYEAVIKASDEFLSEAALYLNSYDSQLVNLQNAIEYSSAENTTESSDSIIWLSGYIPVSEVDNFTAFAKAENWAWCMDDVVSDDGSVPSKVKYNKLTSLMKPVFGILGTVPGYNEYDISFWFLGFFTLFFAMIIGDAAYGCIFLIGAIVLNVKTKKLSDANLLLYVLSVATIIWGSLTGTWFGLEGAMRIPFLKALVIPGIANYPEYFNVTTGAAQNNVMKFCFSIGVIQLVLACIMNIKTKIKAKDLSLVADFGWLIAIAALYFLVLYLVIGQEANLMIVAVIVGAGFLCVVLFGGMSPDTSFAQGLKAGLADAFTVFLNTISAFGNVMSYIRLFAVGMASLAIAQSFNDMAMGFKGPLIIAGAFIMVFGHVLNIVMGFLSVAVHGIRLNLLEFSGQLGMEWSGIEYDPFRKLDKIRK